MFDFRLLVFHTVAQRLNFTKAAQELFITQPAVTKHIREIETHFKVQLFERHGTRIQLTHAGALLLQHTHQLFSLYMNSLSSRKSGKLRIGASTTIAQYLLPPVLAAFHQRYRDIKVEMTICNTGQVEKLLQDKDIELGIIEGHSRNSHFRYSDFVNDELVLVSRKNHSLAKKGSLMPDDLKQIPLLLREPGSGTLEVIAHALKPFNIKLSDLSNEMQLGSSESIKLYLLHSDCLAFLSIHSIIKELQYNELTILDVKGLKMERLFSFIQQHGDTEALPDLFIKFASHYNFR